MPQRGLLLFKGEPIKTDRQDRQIGEARSARKICPQTRWSEGLRPGQGERLHRRRTMTFCTEQVQGFRRLKR